MPVLHGADGESVDAYNVGGGGAGLKLAGNLHFNIVEHAQSARQVDLGKINRDLNSYEREQRAGRYSGAMSDVSSLSNFTKDLNDPDHPNAVGLRLGRTQLSPEELQQKISSAFAKFPAMLIDGQMCYVKTSHAYSPLFRKR